MPEPFPSPWTGFSQGLQQGAGMGLMYRQAVQAEEADKRQAAAEAQRKAMQEQQQDFHRADMLINVLDKIDNPALTEKAFQGLSSIFQKHFPDVAAQMPTDLSYDPKADKPWVKELVQLNKARKDGTIQPDDWVVGIHDIVGRFGQTKATRAAITGMAKELETASGQMLPTGAAQTTTVISPEQRALLQQRYDGADFRVPTGITQPSPSAPTEGIDSTRGGIFSEFMNHPDPEVADTAQRLQRLVNSGAINSRENLGKAQAMLDDMVKESARQAGGKHADLSKPIPTAISAKYGLPEGTTFEQAHAMGINLVDKQPEPKEFSTAEAYAQHKIRTGEWTEDRAAAYVRKFDKPKEAKPEHERRSAEQADDISAYEAQFPKSMLGERVEGAPPFPVFQRFRRDPKMQGKYLGKMTPGGVEVYSDGKLIGHYR